MALKSFTFNGIKSTDYGIMASGNQTYSVPSRSYSAISIPGRNGQLYLDNGNWEPVTIQYQCSSVNGLKTSMQDFLAAINSTPGYHELTDEWHPGVYRKAFLSGGTQVDAFADRHGSFPLTFTARPEKWLVTPDVTLTANGTLSNPTRYDAKPVIKLTFSTSPATGAFRIRRMEGSTVKDEWMVEYESISNSLEIDCENMNCTMNDGMFNANSMVTITPTVDSGELNMEFPYFPASSEIQIAASTWSGVTATVTPRWWTL